MVSFSLGQRVRFTGVVEKTHGLGDKPTTSYVELPNPWCYRGEAKAPYQADEGVVIGRRFVADYRMEQHEERDDFGYIVDVDTQWKRVAGTTRRVWLISYDLRRKPIMAYDHQVEAL